MPASIFVPTLNRPMRQPVAEMLSAARIPYTLIRSPRDTVAESVYTDMGFPVVTVDTWGIRETRQAILEMPAERIIMLDDDLRFFVRHREGARFRAANPTDVKAMIAELDYKLDRFAHGGVMPRYMGNRAPRDFTMNVKYYHVLAYNKALFPKDRTIAFRTAVGEDHDLNLQLLEAGCRNFVLTEWAQDDNEGASGGCSTWRTVELEYREADRLAELHPGLVKRVHHRVYVQWKRAFDEQQERERVRERVPPGAA